MSLNIEFYTFETEVWYRLADGTTEKLTERSGDIITTMLEQIEEFYPAAYAALCNEYERCKPNLTHFRFRIVNRFCKCNFGSIDNIPDVNAYGKFNIECVPCPLLGECKHERVICRPTFNHHISDAEMRVLRLLYQGMRRDEIAEKLYLSIHTVNNHIRNAFTRLGIHETPEFVKWAAENNIFKDEL